MSLPVRRCSSLIALTICVFAVPAAAFIYPIMAERPISEARFGAAAGTQSHPLTAWNDEHAFVVWADDRAGARWGLYGTRVDRDGNLLNPFGVRIEDGALPEAIFWNGEYFVVIASTLAQGQTVAIFVDDEGRLVARRDLTADVRRVFVDVAGSGPGARVLLVTSDGFSATAQIFDAHGNLLTGGIKLSDAPSGFYSTYLIAGSRSDEEFLVIRSLRDERGRCDRASSCFRVISERISTDGRLLSTRDTGLDGPFTNAFAVEGGPDGYLLAGQPWLERTTIVFSLDDEGRFNGQQRTLFANSHTRYMDRRPALTRDGDHFLLAWEVSLETGTAQLHYAELNHDTTLRSTALLGEIVGFTNSVALAVSPAGDRLVVGGERAPKTSTQYDLYGHLFSNGGEDRDHTVLLTKSATPQTNVKVAAGDNGYVVLWSEIGPDSAEHLYLTAIAPDGTSSDEPLEVTSLECCEANYASSFQLSFAIASNGDAYLIVWQRKGESFVRRFGADGQWLDPEPIKLPGITGPLAVASNGRDFLIVTSSLEDGALMARAISSRGVIGGSNVIAPAGDHHQRSIASNGTDYLVVWSEGFRSCPFECIYEPFRIQAVRVRSDGATLDSMPILVEDRRSYAQNPSATWEGERYLVAWHAGAEEVRAARISPEGAVTDRNVSGDGTTLLRFGQFEFAGLPIFPRLLIAGGRSSILPIMRSTVTGEIRWDAIEIPHGVDLQAVQAASPTPLLRAESHEFLLGALDGASREQSFLFAYTRTEAGVSRVFSRIFGEPRGRNRAVRR